MQSVLLVQKVQILLLSDELSPQVGLVLEDLAALRVHVADLQKLVAAYAHQLCVFEGARLSD